MLISALFVFYLAFLPVVASLVWGYQLQAHADLSSQLGWGIAFIAIFVAYTFLGLSNWYGNNWALTGFTRSMFMLSILSIICYMASLIFIPDVFSFSGASALILGANFLSGS
jgi:hypothetical protein